MVKIGSCSPVSTSSCSIRKFPHNTGAAGRLALATGSRLHLIRPLGFSLDEKHVRRTGLDYWAKVDLHVWDSLEELKQAADPSARFWYLSTKARRSHWEADFREGITWSSARNPADCRKAC